MACAEGSRKNLMNAAVAMNSIETEQIGIAGDRSRSRSSTGDYRIRGSLSRHLARSIEDLDDLFAALIAADKRVLRGSVEATANVGLFRTSDRARKHRDELYTPIRRSSTSFSMYRDEEIRNGCTGGCEVMDGDFLETKWVKFIESDFSGIVEIFGDWNIVLSGEGVKLNIGRSFFYLVCPFFF